MPNPHMSTQDWFYHAPSAKSQGASCTVAPVTSQIPGLNIISEDLTEDEDQRCFRRKWIRDTDSKYVKLAKAGGRKHLLKFDNNSKLSSKPVLYPRVDWFDHVNNEAEIEQNLTNNCAVLPEWYVHDQPLDNSEGPKEENENDEGAHISGKRPMLGFDSMSVWKRDNQQAASTSKFTQLPRIRKEKLPSTSRAKFTKKLVKLPKIKSNLHGSDMADLDMKKLLSMDYQKEWLLNKSLEDSKEIEARQTMQKEKEERKKRISNHNLQSLKSRKEIVTEKPLFKLSRFNKVKSCVDSRWSKLESSDKSVAN